MNTAELLDEVTRRGIKLEPDGDALCYTAPKDALTPALLAELKTHKPELLHFLGRTRKRCYGVFEYRRADSRWLTLFSIWPGDTAQLLKRDLSARFGCVIEVREKGPGVGQPGSQAIAKRN